MARRAARLADRGRPVLSLILLVVLWQATAAALSSRYLPGPLEIGETILRDASEGPLLRDLGATLRRSVVAFALAMLAGLSAGLLLGRMKEADAWLSPLLTILLNVPAIVLIVLLFVWFGLTETALVAGVALCVSPSAIVVLREGARVLNAGLGDLGAIYGAGSWSRLRYLILPQLAPFGMAAARNTLAMAWKIVLVAELIGASDGIGFELQTNFQLFDVRGILACSATFVLCVLLIEACIFAPLDRYLAVRG